MWHNLDGAAPSNPAPKSEYFAAFTTLQPHHIFFSPSPPPFHQQSIVHSLLFKGTGTPPPEASVSELSPWVDFPLPPPEVTRDILEAQTHRRFMKTHLPADGLPYFSKAKYIYIVRDVRDIFMSWINHWEKMKEEFYEDMLESTGQDAKLVPKQTLPRYRDEVAKEGGIPRLFDKFISEGCEDLPWENDGWPIFSAFHNIQSWWDCRKMANIHMEHYQNMKDDLDGSMRKIAKFIDVDIEEELWPELVHANTFDEMKKNAVTVAPLGGTVWKGGAGDFIFKGTNGRWKDVLTEENLAKYDQKVKEALTPGCAHWMATGNLEEGMAMDEP
ncbi:unnamed protein product [Chrysoparadoxa australica]